MSFPTGTRLAHLLVRINVLLFRLRCIAVTENNLIFLLLCIYRCLPLRGSTCSFCRLGHPERLCNFIVSSCSIFTQRVWCHELTGKDPPEKVRIVECMC